MKESLRNALQQNAPDLIRMELAKVHPSLTLFLRVRFSAGQEAAEDAASSAVTQVLEQIARGDVFDLERLTSYLRVVARRLYFRELNRSSRYEAREVISDADLSDDLVSDHLEVMVEEERKSALTTCIQALQDDSREFLEFILRNAEATAEYLAEKFRMTVSNVWVKKSRLVKRLHQCVQKKLIA